MSRKQDLKKLKGPDQFQVKAMESVDWLTKHGRELTIVVVLIAIGVGGVTGYQIWEDNKRDARLDELGTIEVSFQQEEAAAEKEREEIRTKIAEIDTKIASAATKSKAEGEAAAAPDANVDVAALTVEKSTLQEQVDGIEADHSVTRDKYKEFFSKYKQTPEGWSAGARAAKLYLAGPKLKEGNLEPARDILQELIKHTSHYIYQTQGRLILSGIFEDQGAYDEGLSLVEEAAKLAAQDDELKPQILFAKGRLLFLKDSKTEARTVFDEIIVSYGSSPEADKARSMKILLN